METIPPPALPENFTMNIVEYFCYLYENEPELSDCMAFTLNPDPSRYQSNDPVQQYKSLLNCVFSKKDIKNTFSRFAFTPELTLTGNVHIHGVYKIKDKIKYFRWFLPACKQWGWTVIKDKINGHWPYDYLPKVMDVMDNLMEELPVPITEYNIDEYNESKKIECKDNIRKIKVIKTKKTVMEYLIDIK